MNVCLISKSEKVNRLFRDMVPATRDVQWAAVGDVADCPAADVYIWDLDGNHEIPDGSWSDGKKAAFLVAAEGAELRALLERAAARRESDGDDGRRGERDEFLQCLLLSSLKLQQYTAERANFVMRALEDLWAPLTAADGYCALLLQETIGALSADQADAIRRLHASIQRVQRTANLLWQLGMDPTQPEAPALVRADVVESLERAITAGAASARAKDITVIADFSQPAAPLYFDPPQIEQALLNLLENAFRFTPRAGVVELKGYAVSWAARKLRLIGSDGTEFQPVAAPDGTNAYRVDVKDPGPAVPVESVDSIFDPYATQSGNDDRSGMGLALANCRLVLAAHGGEVRVEPQRQGATFCIVLPFVRPDRMAEHDRSSGK
jgi:signal transduction histidine kinase